MAWRQALAQALQRSWWRPRRDALATALLPLAALAGSLAGLDRLAHRRGWRHTGTAPVPVIVVGNLVAGGAGKTPTVIALVQALAASGARPGVISRGHGRQTRDVRPVRPGDDPRAVGDEPLLVARRTGVPVWVAPRRLEAARALCAAHPAVDVLVADDGLQHHALARCLELVVFDERGVGNGCLLPAGPLRERLQAPGRPDGVPRLVLYNAPAPTTPLPGWRAERSLAGAVRLADWHAGAPPSRAALEALRGGPLLAAAGLAEPARFFRMLAAEGLTFEALPLPDHAPLDPPPWPVGERRPVVVTEKDAVKLRPDASGPTVWVVPLDFSLPAGLVQAVRDALATGCPR